eukprot:Em0147g2a
MNYPSSKPEPEHEDVPDATPESEDSSESSSEGATTESTPYIFNQLASALHWIMATNYAADLIHYLDDFLLAGPPGQPTCKQHWLPASPFWLVNMFLLVAVGSIDRVQNIREVYIQESSEHQPRHRMFHAGSPPQAKRQPITNEMLGQMLSQLDRDHKPSHDRSVLKATITLGFFGLLSLRIGAATAVSKSGLSPATIKNLGRWWSEAYKVYTVTL